IGAGKKDLGPCRSLAIPDRHILPATKSNGLLRGGVGRLAAVKSVHAEPPEILAFDGVREIGRNIIGPLDGQPANMESIDVARVERRNIMLEYGIGLFRSRPAKIEIAAGHFAYFGPRGANPELHLVENDIVNPGMRVAVGNDASFGFAGDIGKTHVTNLWLCTRTSGRSGVSCQSRSRKRVRGRLFRCVQKYRCRGLNEW